MICSLIFKKWHRCCRARICRFMSSWTRIPPTPRYVAGSNLGGSSKKSNEEQLPRLPCGTDLQVHATEGAPAGGGGGGTGNPHVTAHTSPFGGTGRQTCNAPRRKCCTYDGRRAGDRKGAGAVAGACHERCHAAPVRRYRGAGSHTTHPSPPGPTRPPIATQIFFRASGQSKIFSGATGANQFRPKTFVCAFGASTNSAPLGRGGWRGLGGGWRGLGALDPPPPTRPPAPKKSPARTPPPVCPAAPVHSLFLLRMCASLGVCPWVRAWVCTWTRARLREWARRRTSVPARTPPPRPQVLDCLRRTVPDAAVRHLAQGDFEFSTFAGPVLHASAHRGSAPRVALQAQYVARDCALRFPSTYFWPVPDAYGRHDPKQLYPLMDARAPALGEAQPREDPTLLNYWWHPNQTAEPMPYASARYVTGGPWLRAPLVRRVDYQSAPPRAVASHLKGLTYMHKVRGRDGARVVFGPRDGGGVWHKALGVGSVGLWRRLLASRP